MVCALHGGRKRPVREGPRSWSCVCICAVQCGCSGGRALLAGQVQSTMGTAPLADVREAGRAAGSPLMLYQLYVFKDREFTRQMVQSAQSCRLHELSGQLARRKHHERMQRKRTAAAIGGSAETAGCTW